MRNRHKLRKNSRVHLSEKTLSFLNGEFEVEPAFGEKREEALRIAGLKTYFISKVLKPVSQINVHSYFSQCLRVNELFKHVSINDGAL